MHLTFEVGIIELIMIGGLVVSMIITLKTRASKDEVSKLSDRVGKLEGEKELLEATVRNYCGKLDEIKKQLEEIFRGNSEILQRVSRIEGRQE